MDILRRIITWTSSLKVAIFLLLLIALASAVGTAIPQGNSIESYLEIYQKTPWLGFINGKTLIRFELDHIYSSTWFLCLLGWLGLALMLCSWRRQWPILQAALRWVDYKEPQQLIKLSIAETIPSTKTLDKLEQFSTFLGLFFACSKTDFRCSTLEVLAPVRSVLTPGNARYMCLFVITRHHEV